MKSILVGILLLSTGIGWTGSASADRFEGRYFQGHGDIDYLQLLDISYRMFQPDPELQNISMLYAPAWNGFVEGPTWGAWWIQNSYGPSYAAMPFFTEPYTTFLQNAQELWFSQMGDGKRKGMRNWVAPDGGLCDAAAPGMVIYKQGDGRIDIHDWGMEFTAAGVVLQSELLLIGRDQKAIASYLPLLERSADFIESRRDPKNNLFLAGPAGNLLAPSYAGWKQSDGSFKPAYLTGLSVTYITALDRLIELEKMAGAMDKAAMYRQRRDLARKGLTALTTDEGYLIKYLDPDGTRHGVYGAAKYGYFEAVCNHDAVAFHVIDEVQARKIYNKIASIPGLRPHDLILTNYPGLDDMYTDDKSWLWSFGTWVNGGHWTTCEARMILGYYRLDAHEDARRSMIKLLSFARKFRMDNPLVDFGNQVYQPKEPINCVYDNWGGPAAMIRGLFEYLYRSDLLELRPHIPKGITELDQRFPIRFGTKRLYISTTGVGPVTAVIVNGKPWKQFDAKSVLLPYKTTPDTAYLQIVLGGAKPRRLPDKPNLPTSTPIPAVGDPFWDLASFTTPGSGNNLPLRIGADSHRANQFLGDIRRVRIFRRSLQPDEIAGLAKDPSGPWDDPALLLDYRLETSKGIPIPNAVGPAFAAKIIGQVGSTDGAYRFTGNGYLQAEHDPQLMPGDAYTFEAWICPRNSSSSDMVILSKIHAGLDNGYLLGTTAGSSLRFLNEEGTVCFDAHLKPDVWVHIAATFKSQDCLSLYLNGKPAAQSPAEKPGTSKSFSRIGQFCRRLEEAGLGDGYEARHARLVVDTLAAMHARKQMLQQGTLKPLPEEASQTAADRSYLEAAIRLVNGLQRVLASYSTSQDPLKKRVLTLWEESGLATKKYYPQ